MSFPSLRFNVLSLEVSADSNLKNYLFLSRLNKNGVTPDTWLGRSSASSSPNWQIPQGYCFPWWYSGCPGLGEKTTFPSFFLQIEVANQKQVEVFGRRSWKLSLKEAESLSGDSPNLFLFLFLFFLEYGMMAEAPAASSWSWELEPHAKDVRAGSQQASVPLWHQETPSPALD